jgi:hypothetical protein
LDAALPVLVGATLAFHDRIVIRRTTSVETMTVSYKSVCWTGRVDEDTKSNNRRGEENVEERHSACSLLSETTIINECGVLLSWTLFEAASRD